MEKVGLAHHVTPVHLDILLIFILQIMNVDVRIKLCVNLGGFSTSSQSWYLLP